MALLQIITPDYATEPAEHSCRSRNAFIDCIHGIDCIESSWQHALSQLVYCG